MNANLTDYERENNVNQKTKQYEVDAVFKTVEKKINEWPFTLFSTKKMVKYEIDAVFA